MLKEKSNNKLNKKPINRFIGFLCGTFFSVLCLANISFAEGISFDQDTLDLDKIQNTQVRNLVMQENKIFTGGQPNLEDLKNLSEAGVRHIINLRPVKEQSWKEGDVVQSLGMQYHSLPISGAQDITLANAEKLSKLLTELKGESILLHCASGNRVGALVAISAYEAGGLDVVSAIEKGRQWGLTKLEALVRDRLSGD